LLLLLFFLPCVLTSIPSFAVKFKRFFFQVTHGISRQRAVSKISLSDTGKNANTPPTLNSYTIQLELMLSQAPTSSIVDIQMLLLREEWIK